MALIYCDGDSELSKAYAKEAAEALVTAYANHSWWVEVRGGALIIKHFAIHGMIGMVRHTSSLDHDAGSRKRQIIMAAGELLERAGLARGAYNGDVVQDFDADKNIRKRWLARPGMPMKVIH